MALEFREPNVAKLQRSISWQQFRRWRMFDKIHPIDSRDRNSADIARAAVIIASAMGAKDLKEEGLNIAGFQPEGAKDYIAPHSQKRRKKAETGIGDINTIMSALGASDGSKRR